jgi:protein TonB
MSGRTPFFVFSVTAHLGLAIGLGRMHVSESHAATAIEIADVSKAKKAEPPKAVMETEPPKTEHHAPVRRAAAAPPPPAQNTPPPPAPRARVALADTSLQDFGVSLSGAVGGDGIALPAGGGPVAAAVAPARSAPVHRALAMAAGPSSTADACDEPAGKPHALNVPQPAYNANARAAGIEGKVRVRLTVDATGKVIDVAVIAGLGYGLDEAALAAAREATFEPALRCGKPVQATFTISMRFTAG